MNMNKAILMFYYWFEGALWEWERAGKIIYSEQWNGKNPRNKGKNWKMHHLWFGIKH